jgi:hypothetical protein
MELDALHGPKLQLLHFHAMLSPPTGSNDTAFYESQHTTTTRMDSTRRLPSARLHND